MSEHTIQLSRQGPVFTITLDVPGKLNALGSGVLAALKDTLDACAADPDMRVLILTGAGRAFCAGLDLKEPALFTAEAEAEGEGEGRAEHLRKRIDEAFNTVIRKLIDMPVPTIAAVNGVAAGGGYGLALACDLVIAAESADFILVFTPQLGLIPDMGSSWHAPRALGRGRALSGAFFGEPMPAREAANLGLIWKAVPDGELSGVVEATARTLSEGPTRAYVAVRHAMDKALTQSLPEQLDLEARIQPDLLVSEDFEEAVRAFLAKRKPVFKGK